MTQDQNERLKELITKLTLKSIYWGYLFNRIKRIDDPTLDKSMGIYLNENCTISLAYNSKYLAFLSNNEILKCLEHEGLHILNKHITRGLKVISYETLDEDKQLEMFDIWNIACDCAVNCMIDDMPKFLLINNEKLSLIFPSTFKMEDKKSAEFYFYELLNRQYKSNKKIVKHNWYDDISKICDVDSFRRKTETYIRDIIKDSVKNFLYRGTLGENLEELINSFLEPPKLPYFMIIRKLVKASKFSKFKRSLTKINRKRMYTFLIDNENNTPIICPFPGKTRDFSFKIVVLIDTSGSITIEFLKESLSGIKDIIEKDKHCELTVIENDTDVKKEYKVRKINEIEFNIKGRGGTVLAPGLKRCREISPDVTLCFTDGYTDNINEISKKELPKKIIYILPKNGNGEKLDKTGYVIKGP